MRLCTLKRSAEFHRIRGGTRWSGSSFLIEGKARPVTQDLAAAAMSADGDGRKPVASMSLSGPRFGFTVTRKLGGAVVRNRIRRRLREALRGIEDGLTDPRFDYVVVARKPAADIAFADLSRDFRRAFSHIHRQPAAVARRGA